MRAYPPGVLNHGNHFHDLYTPCEADPSSWCSLFTGEIGPNFTQYRYESYLYIVDGRPV